MAAPDDEDDGGLPPGGQTWHDLETPRPLHPPERELVEALAAALEHDAATEQARTVVVQATCSCGCPSLRLRVDGPLLPAADVLRLSDGRRDDYVSVEARAPRRRAEDVAVTLHVLGGLLHELEIFAGEGVDVPLPAAASLRAIDVA